MHPHLERMLAYELIAHRIDRAGHRRAERPQRPQFRFSLRMAFGRHLVRPGV